MKLSKRKLGTFLAGVVALSLLTGSWAFYNSTHSIDNKLKTEGYSEVFKETFTPDNDWQPGDQATKEAGVTNTGVGDLVVRVKMEETWARAATPDTPYISLNTGSANFYPTAVGTGRQGDVDDGLTTGDGTVVYKNTSFGNWVKDGEWYYFKDVLHTNGTTGNFLNSITLCGDTDMGVIEHAKYYTTYAALENVVPVDDGSANDNTSTNPDDHASKWIPLVGTNTYPTNIGTVYLYSSSGVSPTNPGYSGSQYVLTITAETCAATKSAVTGEWSAAAANLAGTNWNF